MTINGGADKVWYIHSMKYLTLKRNEVLTLAIMWLKLKNMVSELYLNNGSQTFWSSDLGQVIYPLESSVCLSMKWG